MSLLEDVFLEDEAGEAQELERIIEGDVYDERPRPSTPDSNEDSEKEDEAEEDKRHVAPTSAKPKRIVKNPRVVLNPARLTGPRGIQVIPDHFKDFMFKGKGHEKEDLDLVLKKLEHWAYRLYPRFEFKDCLKKIETLGKKRPVMVHLTKIRSDQFMSDETVVQRDSSDDETPEPVQEEDEFDKLLQQQIELARATPGGTAKGFTTPMVDKSIMPKATSSPSINDEQRERMLQNRQLAEERRIARLKLNKSETGQEISTNNAENNRQDNSTDNTLEVDLRDNKTSKVDENGSSIDEIASTIANNGKDKMHVAEENITRAKSNRSTVIDSSDSENDGLVINESVTVDVHSQRNYDSDEESDTGHQNKNDEKNENEQHSDKDQNKNTVEDISEDTSDVEMIDYVNKSKSSEKDKIADLNKINQTSNSNIDEITKNNIDSDMLQSNDDSTVVSKQISKNENDLKNAEDKSFENKETAIADLDDIEDVDFSNDF